MEPPPIIPLPEHLKECGCPGAPFGRHTVSCEPAREHASIPLEERDGYVEGARFRCIAWDYPLQMTAQVHVEVELDPVAYIIRHRDAYDAFVVPPGHHDWEKPMVFLADRVEEGCDEIWAALPFGYDRLESNVRSFIGELRESPRWGPEDTEALHAALLTDPDGGSQQHDQPPLSGW